MNSRQLRITYLLAVWLLPGCIPEEGTIASRQIYDGAPRFDIVQAGIGVDALFADGPSATFTEKNTTRFVKTNDDRLVVEHNSHVEHVASQGTLMSTRTHYTFPNSSNQVTDWKISASDLFEVVRLSVVKQPSSLQLREIHFKKIVTDISNVSGQLFPLQVGNELSFSATWLTQAVKGAPTTNPHEDIYGYRYRVVEELDGYADAEPPVEGRVFVISRTEIHPDGWHDRVELLYSMSLGTTILERREDEGVLSEDRIAAWN